MERLHVNNMRELIHRLRLGQSERAVARDLHLGRVTVHKYHELAASGRRLVGVLPGARRIRHRSAEARASDRSRPSR